MGRRTSVGLCPAGLQHSDIKADIRVGDRRPVAPQAPRPLPPRRLGLSGKLLLLTIPLVMIAGLMIYVPSIANFWTNRLNDRLAAANTAAWCWMPRRSAWCRIRWRGEILTSVGARAVAIKMGQQRRLLASADLPPAIDRDIDMRTLTVWSAIADPSRPCWNGATGRSG